MDWERFDACAEALLASRQELGIHELCILCIYTYTDFYVHAVHDSSK